MSRRPLPTLAAVSAALLLPHALLACSSAEHPPFACQVDCVDAADADASPLPDALIAESGDAAGDAAGDADAPSETGVPGNPCHGVPGDYMWMNGTPGDPIFEGEFKAGGGEPATFSLPVEATDLVSVRAVRTSTNTAALMLFATDKTGEALAVGSYPNAAYYKYSQAGLPAFNLTVNARNCEEATGGFEILAISFEAGHLRGIEAKIVRHCDFGTIEGCVKYGAVP